MTLEVTGAAGLDLNGREKGGIKDDVVVVHLNT